jgi:hypothetical protein
MGVNFILEMIIFLEVLSNKFSFLNIKKPVLLLSKTGFFVHQIFR